MSVRSADQLAQARLEELGRIVYAVLELGEKDCRLLDDLVGRRFSAKRWQDARAALFELYRRAERVA